MIKATLKYSRTSPRKMRMVADLIRGLQVEEAEKLLEFTIRRPAKPILKLLKSAVANAENNFNLKKNNLYVSEIKVDGGPMLKRFRPRARGVAYPIQKKTSHVSIQLAQLQEGKTAKKKRKEEKIKKVYQEEKPKDDVSLQDKQRQADKSGKQGKEKIKEKDTKGEKKQIFRRKSI
jgi:large subunit ribosomal protein L22